VLRRQGKGFDAALYLKEPKRGTCERKMESNDIVGMRQHQLTAKMAAIGQKDGQGQ
jgi:hypothetical protein